MGANDCIFCKIYNGETPGEILYSDSNIFVIKDINPRAPVHLLIIPIRHLTSLAYIGPAQVPIIGQIFVVAEEMARRQGITLSGYRVVINQGPDSGQIIDHIHYHLIGGAKLKHLG